MSVPRKSSRDINPCSNPTVSPTSGTLTPLLKKLEAQGYVERSRDPRDERNIIIRLTDKGRELKSMAVCVPRQMIDSLDIGNMKAVVLMKTLHQLMDAFAEDEANT